MRRAWQGIRPRGLRLRTVLFLSVGLGATALGLVAYGTDALRNLELDSVDARFSIRGDAEASIGPDRRADRRRHLRRAEPALAVPAYGARQGHRPHRGGPPQGDRLRRAVHRAQRAGERRHRARGVHRERQREGRARHDGGRPAGTDRHPGWRRRSARDRRATRQCAPAARPRGGQSARLLRRRQAQELRCGRRPRSRAGAACGLGCSTATRRGSTTTAHRARPRRSRSRASSRARRRAACSGTRWSWWVRPRRPSRTCTRRRRPGTS